MKADVDYGSLFDGGVQSSAAAAAAAAGGGGGGSLRSASGGAASANSAAADARDALVERGEKLSQLSDR